MDGYPASSGVSRIVCSCIVVVIIGFDYVVPSIEGFIANKLDADRPVGELLDRENGNVLGLVTVKGHSQYNVVYVSIDIVLYGYVVDVIVAVQIEVVYLRVCVVK